jgi:recombinational DNA repair protein (RecF pathway)
LREIQLQETHPRLREELAWVHQASYFAVLIERGTEKETPIPEVYELFRAALVELEGSRLSARILFGFELKLLTVLGYEPEFRGVSPEAGKLATELKETAFDAILSKPSARIYEELDRYLQRTIGTVLDYLPPQREKAMAALLAKAPPRTIEPS